MCLQTVEVVVKRTFLEFVEVHGDEEACGDQRLLMRRAKTEPYRREHSSDRKGADLNSMMTATSSSEASSTTTLLGGSMSITSTRDMDNTEATPASIEEVAGVTRSSRNEDNRTTLMLRNLPNDYNREMFLDMLDLECLAGEYDFVYFPMDFKTGSGLGYAFVDFTSHEEALRAWKLLHGYNDWLVPSAKICDVCWSSPVQGFRANVQRYRNSPVMHHKVPDSCKPVVFSNGMRIQFPAPKKPIKCMPVQKASKRHS